MLKAYEKIIIRQQIRRFLHKEVIREVISEQMPALQRMALADSANDNTIQHRFGLDAFRLHWQRQTRSSRNVWKFTIGICTYATCLQMANDVYKRCKWSRQRVVRLPEIFDRFRNKEDGRCDLATRDTNTNLFDEKQSGICPRFL